VPSGGVTLKRRCTYRPSVIYLIVNKLLSLSSLFLFFPTVLALGFESVIISHQFFDDLVASRYLLLLVCNLFLYFDSLFIY
jgi:hypothetical protein